MTARRRTASSRSSRIRDDRGHWQSWRDCVVVKSDLVRWDHHGTSTDVYTNGEVDVRQTSNFREDIVVELATDVVVEGDSDGYLSVGHQFSLVWCEDQSDSFIV